MSFSGCRLTSKQPCFEAVFEPAEPHGQRSFRRAFYRLVPVDDTTLVSRGFRTESPSPLAIGSKMADHQVCGHGAPSFLWENDVIRHGVRWVQEDAQSIKRDCSVLAGERRHGCSTTSGWPVRSRSFRNSEMINDLRRLPARRRPAGLSTPVPAQRTPWSRGDGGTGIMRRNSRQTGCARPCFATSTWPRVSCT